ncbi:MAG: asparagine synthase C-terminal domain-containing protein [Candidatus Altiarchaeota archaeon]|nr:asparagine synthase C-terminal domain-containing protein [Candidatus Altiarchaeota archaeon]
MDADAKDIAREALELLERSVKACCSDKKAGLIFSAGIDSTLVGFLASRNCKVTAYTTGIAGSHDLDYAGKAESELPFTLRKIEVSEEEIERDLPKLVSITKSASPLDISVAIPFYYASRQAGRDKQKTVLCGQGADELFGGYNRYIELISKGTYEQLEELMEKDLKELPKSNLARDRAICKANGVTLEIPFLGSGFSEYARKIPIQLKVKEITEFEKPEYDCVDEINGMRFIRKYILRKMAEQAGLPNAIIQREKKAAQYGSGSQKTLEKLARKTGFKQKAAAAGRKDYTQMYLESMREKR